MPEMIEVEYYRRVAERTVGRSVQAVVAPDDWYLKGDTTARALRATVTGRTVTGTSRIGKLLLLATDGPVLGLRFGMTGRLLVDGAGPIEKLEYSSGRNDPAWTRFALRFDDGGDLRMVDPRRLGGVLLDPDTTHLGIDALAVTPTAFRRAVETSRAPLKAWLLDQGHVAGIGNLLADEILWRAGLDPARSGRSLDPAEVALLHRTLRKTVRLLTKRGGSHTGDLQVARVRGAACPRDGAPLQRRTIGGRTTYSCPVHQG
ncbi:MAG: DNA-formamidopyrimidine glycosylase family protein [Acidimicrobiales bacterium]